jgi:RsiW-degrading membrane proteinase PrsW (M82 family)
VDPRPVPIADWVAGGSAVLCAALAWLSYFRWKDRRPEPWGVVAASFLLGASSTGLVIVVYAIAQRLGLPTWNSKDPRDVFIFCVFIVGPVEEGAKFLATWAVAFRSRHFDEEIDGLVYSTAVALGFASVENLFYFPLVGWGWRLARVVSTPLAHAVFSSVWGFGMGWARFNVRSRAGRFAWIFGTLLLGAAVHGLYDHLVLAYRATPVAAGVVMLLWIALVLRARGIVQNLGGRGTKRMWVRQQYQPDRIARDRA